MCLVGRQTLLNQSISKFSKWWSSWRKLFDTRYFEKQCIIGLSRPIVLSLKRLMQSAGRGVMRYNECQYLAVTDATVRCNFVKWNTRYAPSKWAGMNSGGTLMSIIDHSGYKMTLGQLMPQTTCYHGSTSSSRSNVILLDIFILYSVPCPCMLWKCINKHVYSPNDSKEQTICKTDRQTETDKEKYNIHAVSIHK